MRALLDLSRRELTTIFEEWGEPSFRVDQIWHGIYQKLWNDPSEFTDLPVRLRNRIAREYTFNILEPVLTHQTHDHKTTKTAFRLNDGKAIEAVQMDYSHRNTICISTQVGCAMNCAFCATGKMGFIRQLTSGEIIAQVLYFARILNDLNKSITNIVFMGMGEPFHNYDNVMSSIDRLNDGKGLNVGSRRFTISSVGLVPAIKRFTKERRQVNLAISLHAASDELRESMIPIAKVYRLDELLSACQGYVEETGRRISFEWALINGINDTIEQAHLLAERLSEILCHVNIIPLNIIAGYQGTPASRERAREFQRILVCSGVPCTMRIRRGMEIQAGCGQLAGNL